MSRGDVSTDGRWSFLSFVARVPPPAPGAPPPAVRWRLLQQRLEAVVPRPGAGLGSGSGSGSESDGGGDRGGGDPGRPARGVREFCVRVAAGDTPGQLGRGGGKEEGGRARARARTPTPLLPSLSGVLHALVDALWATDLTVLRAAAGRGDGGAGADDAFVVADARDCPAARRAVARGRARGVRPPPPVLPAPARVAEVEAAVRAAVGGGECRVSITPAAPAPGARPARRTAPRRPCAAAAAASSLADAAAARGAPRRAWSSDGTTLVDAPALATPAARADGGASVDRGARVSWADARGGVDVGVDNSTARAYTLLTVACPDRKGLVYDLMRTLKDVAVRVAYARVETDGGGGGGGPPPLAGVPRPAAPPPRPPDPAPPPTARIDLFVCDAARGGRVTDAALVEELVARVTRAAGLPLGISLCKATGGGGGTGAGAGPASPASTGGAELTVTAPVDAGGRGRPRVTADVTAALAALGLDVVSADVFVESEEDGGGGGGGSFGGDRGGLAADSPPRPGAPLPPASTVHPSPPRRREVHRFLVAGPGAGSADARRALADAVERELAGSAPGGGLGGGRSESPAGGLGDARPPAVAPPASPARLVGALAGWRWGAGM